MISFGLDDEQQIIQETVRNFAKDEIRPRMREFERAGGMPDWLRRRFHELGLPLLEAPQELGGQGAGGVTAAIVHEELAFGDPGAAVALWAPHLVLPALLLLGDSEQQQRFLPRFAETGGFGRTGAFAWSERRAPPEGFSTTARPSGDGYVLDGKKAFVINGGIADLTIVVAQLEGSSCESGAAAFVIEAGARGLKPGARHQLLGLETVHTADLVLEGCQVPERNRIRGGGSDFPGKVRELLARGALANAARQVGLARASYEFALDFTQERRAFGKPVAHFQSIAFTLADMHMDVESARWMVWRAASQLELGGAALPLVAEAVAHANQAAWRVANNGVQLLGGAGFIQDYPVEKWMRDTKALALFGLPSEAADMIVAEAELGVTWERLPSAAVQPFFT